MADNDKAVINLTTGHEDADKVTIAFLVATAALTKGKDVTMFLTKEAVRLGLPGSSTPQIPTAQPGGPAGGHIPRQANHRRKG